MREQIVKASNSAKDLEALYRSAPKEFGKAFPDAYQEVAESPLLEAWNERLKYDLLNLNPIKTKSTPWRAKDIYITLFLIFIAGTLAKLPQFISGINGESELFYVRNIPSIAIGACVFR